MRHLIQFRVEGFGNGEPVRPEGYSMTHYAPAFLIRQFEKTLAIPLMNLLAPCLISW